jgi:hypothetical protein
MTDDKILAALQKATKDLLFPSESEFDIVPFLWKNSAAEKLSTGKVLSLAGKKTTEKIAEADYKALFKAVAEPQDWHDNTEKKDVKKFQRLLKTLEENLKDLRAYRIGKITIDVIVVGSSASGNWLGIATQVVET